MRLLELHELTYIDVAKFLPLVTICSELFILNQSLFLCAVRLSPIRLHIRLQRLYFMKSAYAFAAILLAITFNIAATAEPETAPATPTETLEAETFAGDEHGRELVESALSYLQGKNSLTFTVEFRVEQKGLGPEVVQTQSQRVGLGGTNRYFVQPIDPEDVLPSNFTVISDGIKLSIYNAMSNRFVVDEASVPLDKLDARQTGAMGPAAMVLRLVASPAALPDDVLARYVWAWQNQ